jgi:hypothetical protein
LLPIQSSEVDRPSQAEQSSAQIKSEPTNPSQYTQQTKTNPRNTKNVVKWSHVEEIPRKENNSDQPSSL